MKNITEFIRSKIQLLQDNTKNINAKHFYDDRFRSHIVVISPAKEMLENDFLTNWESEFWDDYFDACFEEEVVILGDDDIETFNNYYSE